MNLEPTNHNTAPHPAADIQTWQHQLVQSVLRILVVVAPLAAVAGSYYDYTHQTYWIIPIYWLAWGLVLLVTFWRRVPYAAQAGLIVVVFYALAVLDFATDGRGGSGRLFLLLMAFAAGLLFGRWGGIFSLGLAIATIVGMGWVISTGYITIRAEVSSTDPAGWASNTLVLLLLGTFVVASHNYVIPRLMAALAQSRQLAQELDQERGRLAEQVTERTQDLQRRNVQLEAAAQVGRDAASVLNVDELLLRVVNLISARFGFYHVGLFLADPSGAWMELKAVSSEGGRRMLERGHRLRIEDKGIVGLAAQRGQARIALDTGADAAFLTNPDLPDTRSEVALPLQARGQIIGVLDVQSTAPQAFSDQDIAVLQTLADQVALAIGNAQLFQQSQESLEAERRAFGELSRQAWTQLLQTRAAVGFVCDQGGTAPAGNSLEPQMLAAMQKKQAVLADGDAAALALPIKVRDQVIGVVDMHRPSGTGAWTPDQIAIVQTLTDQLSVALESARLYQDTQRRAAQEQLVGEVTSRMRETLDVETVLRTAAQELRLALGVPELNIRLAPPDKEASS